MGNVAWTLNNFRRGKPQPNIKYIKDAIEALTVMLTLPDNEILQDANWGFSCLSDSDDIGSLTQSNNNNNKSKEEEKDKEENKLKRRIEKEREEASKNFERKEGGRGDWRKDNESGALSRLLDWFKRWKWIC